MLSRAYGEFRRSVDEARVVQFGGPAGTLSAYGTAGPQIAAELARELGLRSATISWHSARDRFARVGAASALLAAAAARIGKDVSLLMQPEIGEAMEPAASGRGGSSSMPHKRNPAGCLLAIEAAQRAPGLVATLFNQLVPEHERGLGQWQTQWFTLRALLGAAGSALAAMAEVSEGLEVHADAMQRNLNASGGLVYSEAVAVRLAASLGKAQAHAMVEKLCVEAVRSRRDLQEVLSADETVTRSISKGDLAELFCPQSSFGAAPAMMEGVLRDWQLARAGGTT
jgi:3-carboxy-cis,cis-muconate cycloisomerase